jgi:tol-pal system protein YbgF
MTRSFLRPGRAAAWAAALLVLSGCATKHDLQDLRLDLRALAVRQDSILSALARQNAVTQDTLRRQTNQLFEIRGDIASQLRGLQQSIDRLAELTGQNQRTIAALRDQMEGLRQARPSEPAPGTGEAIVPGQTQDPNAATNMFNAARQQLDQDQIGTAQLAFEDFLRTYPNDDRAPDARFYLADILDQQQKYKEAAEAFNQIPSLYPTSPKVPEALYRVAVLDADHLNKKAEARTLLQKVINSYGDSDVAGLARQKLRAIGR